MHGIQELVAVPTCGERSCLRFAIAHHTRNDEVRIVKGSASRINALALAHRRHARAVAKMCENDPTARRRFARRPFLFVHQEGVGHAVKAIAPHPSCEITAGNGEDLGDPRQVPVERGIEARDLHQLGIVLGKTRLCSHSRCWSILPAIIAQVNRCANACHGFSKVNLDSPEPSGGTLADEHRSEPGPVASYGILSQGEPFVLGSSDTSLPAGRGQCRTSAPLSYPLTLIRGRDQSHFPAESRVSEQLLTVVSHHSSLSSGEYQTSIDEITPL
jgi:hypothetical protein